MILLEVHDWNSQAIEATLDDTLFYIVLNWNESNQSWEIGIRNSAYRMIINGIALVANYPLTYQFRYPSMPRGELWCLSGNWTNGPVPRDGFTTNRYQLVYETEQELIDKGILAQYGRTSPNAF